MAVLLIMAVVFILALLAVVVKQRKQIRAMTVAPPLQVTPTYETVNDITGKQNIELTGNVAYGHLNK